MSLLENALVVLFDGKRAFWAYTDETGKVNLTGIPPGDYKLAVIKEGYIGYVGDISITEDTSTSITLTKPTGAVELRDGVALSVSEMTIRNLLLEIFDTRGDGKPQYLLRLVKMFYRNLVSYPEMLLKQGVSSVYKEEFSHQVEEILLSESPKFVLEVEE